MTGDSKIVMLPQFSVRAIASGNDTTLVDGSFSQPLPSGLRISYGPRRVPVTRDMRCLGDRIITTGPVAPTGSCQPVSGRLVDACATVTQRPLRHRIDGVVTTGLRPFSARPCPPGLRPSSNAR
jgi:hypothetical protein